MANTHSFKPEVMTRAFTLPDTMQIRIYRMIQPATGQITGLSNAFFILLFTMITLPSMNQEL